MPSYADGYCIDDNARALLLMVLLVVERYAGAPAARDEVFRLRAARLRPRQPPLSELHGVSDRRWRDETGSDDCLGRCLWVLGTCGRSTP